MAERIDIATSQVHDCIPRISTRDLSLAKEGREGVKILIAHDAIVPEVAETGKHIAVAGGG